MTWPTKWQRQRETQWQWQRQRETQWQWQGQWQRQWQIHLDSTFTEWSLILLTFETFDQSDEETWHDQQKDNNKNKYNDDDKHI